MAVLISVSALVWFVIAGPKPSLAATPPGYTLYSSISADFDGDGLKEQAKAYFDEGNQFDKTGRNPIVVVSKNGKTIWKYTCRHGNQIVEEGGYDNGSCLQALDITADGRAELLLTTCCLGVSDGRVSLHIFQWRDKRFIEIVEPQDEDYVLTHQFQGGVVLETPSNSKKPYGIVLVSYVWGEHEDHYDFHKYKAERYEFRNGCFRFAKSWTTRTRAET